MTSIASQTSRLIPQYIHENYREFSNLVEYYLKFIEQTHVQKGQILHRPQDLLNNLILSHDVDKTGRRITPKDQINDADVEYTVTKFLEFYKKNYLATLPYFGPKGSGESHYYDRTNTTIPESLSTEFTNFVKRIRDYYRNKGNVTSYKFFFRSIFNVDMSVDYPTHDILRVSDGDWYDPYYVRFAFYPDDQEPENTNWQDVQLLEVSDIDVIYNKVIRAFEYVYENGNQVFEDDGSPKKKVLARAVIGPRVWFSNLVEAWETDMVPWITLIEREGVFEEGQMIDICEVCDDTQEDIVLDNVINVEGKQLRILDSNFDMNTYTYVGDQSNLERYDGGPADGQIIGNDQVAYIGNDQWAVFFDNNGTDDYTVLDPEINPEYLGVETRLPGRWLSNDGFLSDQKFLQDNFYYQDFSYEIKTTISRRVWDQYVQKNLHPAGMILFNVLLASDVDPFLFTANFEKVWQIYWTTVLGSPSTYTIDGRGSQISGSSIHNIYRNYHEWSTQEKYYWSLIETIDESNSFKPEKYSAEFHPLNSTWVFVNGYKMNAFDDYIQVRNSQYKIDWRPGHNAELNSHISNMNSSVDMNLFHLNEMKNPVINGNDKSFTITNNIGTLENEIEISNVPTGYLPDEYIESDEIMVFYNGQLIPGCSVNAFDLDTSNVIGLQTYHTTDAILNEFSGVNELDPNIEIIFIRDRNRVVHYNRFSGQEYTLPNKARKDDVVVFGSNSEGTLQTFVDPRDYSIGSNNKLRINDGNSYYTVYVFNSYLYPKRTFAKELTIQLNTQDRILTEPMRVRFAGRESFFPYVASEAKVQRSINSYYHMNSKWINTGGHVESYIVS